ncbi:DeSI family protein [Abortiporus biennis]
MSNLVQLYVYDLSNGLAKQLSRQLTGRQIDGIWHTSVVVFNKEVFYGQGISITAPGRSHHGKPLQVIEMGETAIDEETFDEYINEMREHYTADKYHLLDFNCNSFTNDCVGFLTGNSIPEWIRDLPSDFLSTPFGAALRPTIDNMFRQPGPLTSPPTPQPSIQPPSVPPTTATPDSAITSALLQAVAARAASTPAAGQPNSVSAPMHICTNPTTFHNILVTHKAVIGFFTSATCGPCRMIEPVFERFAEEKTQGNMGVGAKIAFVKVDIGVGMGSAVGGQFGVRVTPTFIFFLNGKKTHELKGADQGELKTQIDLLLWEAFPPHPHTKLSLPTLQKISTNPILFSQVPNLDVVLTKFTSLLPPSSSAYSTTLSAEFIPFLKARFSTDKQAAKHPSPSREQLTRWTDLTKDLISSLQPAQLFPLVDMWRLAILDSNISSHIASSSSSSANDLVDLVLLKALSSLSSPSDSRNFILTTLRLGCNSFSSPFLSPASASNSGKKKTLATNLFVSAVLSEDKNVKNAAASLGFNLSAVVQAKHRQAGGNGNGNEEDQDAEWEIEIISAVLEALKDVKNLNEDVAHRLTACLGFLLYLSPVSSYEGNFKPLLEVLQAKEVLESLLSPTGEGAVVKKKEVKALIKEVVELC